MDVRAERESGPCSRGRPLARIMSNPGANRPAPPRPPPRSGRATAVLERLTALSQELAGAYRPATGVESMARATSESLAPERLSISLLDLDVNPLLVSAVRWTQAAASDESPIQLHLPL